MKTSVFISERAPKLQGLIPRPSGGDKIISTKLSLALPSLRARGQNPLFFLNYIIVWTIRQIRDTLFLEIKKFYPE